MTKKLSDLNKSLEFVPQPLSPDVAGFIQSYGGTTAPEGWLECDGSAVSRTTYAELFANIGTKYGIGDGSTTFNLPDGPRRTVEVDLSFSSTPAGWSLTSGKGYAEQEFLGKWFLYVNIDANITGTTNANTTVDGITFISGKTQSVPTSGASSSVVVYARTFSGTGQIDQISNSSGGNTRFRVNARLELDSQPTDAFVTADSRFSTFDEALEDIPLIKAFNDSSNISMEIKDATATKTGAVRLNSDFAGTDTVHGLFLNSVAADANLQYLVPEYRETTVELTNSGANNMNGTINLTKVGNTVTLSADDVITHTSTDLPVSATGEIPTDFRPSNDVFNTYYYNETAGYSVRCQPTGEIAFIYRNESGAVNQTSTLVRPSISYVIT